MLLNETIIYWYDRSSQVIHSIHASCYSPDSVVSKKDFYLRWSWWKIISSGHHIGHGSWWNDWKYFSILERKQWTVQMFLHVCFSNEVELVIWGLLSVGGTVTVSWICKEKWVRTYECSPNSSASSRSIHFPSAKSIYTANNAFGTKKKPIELHYWTFQDHSTSILIVFLLF